MITSTQLQHYCQELALPSQAAEFLARVRQSDSVRRVQGRAGNVSGFYSSRKMGMTIQFESLIELGAIYLAEQLQDDHWSHSISAGKTYAQLHIHVSD